MNGHRPHTNLPDPRPELTPQQVVAIQLEALQHNDSPVPDSGIRAAFNFASPGNQAATGPLERFILLVKNSLYRSMLNFKQADLEPMIVQGNQARQRVHLTAANDERVTYVFQLSRQEVWPYMGCWMTDGVIRE